MDGSAVSASLVEVHALAGSLGRDALHLVESSWQGEMCYRQGHIPGAVHLDLSLLEDPVTLNVLPGDELLSVLLGHGFTAAAPAVVYGKDQLSAFRAATILLYAGVRDVRVLDGGYPFWLMAGFGVETGINETVPAQTFGCPIPAHPEYFIDTANVRLVLADPAGRLVSVRSWAEFTGQISGYDYIQATGRIAGAVWGYSGSDADHMEDYLLSDGRLRPLQEIASRWTAAGIGPENKVAFYCGTGWRASVAFFAAYCLGLPDISVYDGGWLAWSLDPDYPIAMGIPPAAGPD